MFGLIAALGLWTFYVNKKSKSTAKVLIQTEITSVPKVPTLKNNPQFVILSFDGSRSVQMWQDTRKFASELRQKNININFTYFISGVYFLADKDRFNYQGPGQAKGDSLIGFGGSQNEIAQRVNEVNLAKREGHEIASHLNGHFRGSSWSKAQWTSEITQFGQFSPVKDVVGLRTPLLSRNNLLYTVLPNLGYKYDSSAVGKEGDWPVKNDWGTWEIPLVTIPIAGTRGSTISMDYNFFIAQTQANDVLKKNNPLWTKDYHQVVDSYLNYFNNDYLGNRAPVVIGHHFSTWNDGLYWEAMKTFASEVCGKPEVICGTFSQLVKYLDSN